MVLLLAKLLHHDECDKIFGKSGRRAVVLEMTQIRHRLVKTVFIQCLIEPGFVVGPVN